MVHIMDEAQDRGLIDRYWILNYIIIPTILIGIVIGITYIEDVSSYFPYNMPKWFAWILIIGLPICIIILLRLKSFSKCQS